MQFILKVLLVLALFAVAACGNNTTKETGRKEAAATEEGATPAEGETKTEGKEQKPTEVKPDAKKEPAKK